LIVDDEASIRSLLSEVFGQAGHEVRAASSAAETLDLCRRDCVDAALSDVLMPGEEGHALARQVAVLCPRNRVILMSGCDPGCDGSPYRSRRPSVGKPLHLRQLVICVAEFLASPLRDRGHVERHPS
jgi:DNA-binding NtrC family response regulator